MNHKGTQTITTERLILRRFTVEDAQEMFSNWASDDEVTKFLSWPTHGDVGITKMLLENWVDSYAREDFYQWAMELDGQLIGTISVVEQNPDVEMVEIGYCIGKAWWHKGFTSEALQAVLEYLLDEVGVRRVQARHDARNPNSGKVMAKCGMMYEGTLRQANRNNQGICDVCMYSLLASQR